MDACCKERKPKRAKGEFYSVLNAEQHPKPLPLTHTRCFSMVLRSSSPRVQASGLEASCARVPPAKYRTPTSTWESCSRLRMCSSRSSRIRSACNTSTSAMLFCYIDIQMIAVMPAIIILCQIAYRWISFDSYWSK